MTQKAIKDKRREIETLREMGLTAGTVVVCRTQCAPVIASGRSYSHIPFLSWISQSCRLRKRRSCRRACLWCSLRSFCNWASNQCPSAHMQTLTRLFECLRLSEFKFAEHITLLSRKRPARNDCCAKKLSS